MEISSIVMKKCTQKLLLARMRLLQNNGFYGILLMHMKFVLADEIETATVDDRKMYFNSRFIMSLSDKELEYVMMHLITHVALRHTLRSLGLKPEEFYSACDIVVNSNILRSCNMDENSIRLESEGGVQKHLAPDGTEGYEHSVEELYSMLLASETGGESDNEADSTSDGKSDSGKENESENKPGNNSGSKGWDKHLSLQFDTYEDADMADAEWRQRLIDAAEITERRERILIDERSKTRGMLPLFAERILMELRTPQTDWRQVLDEFVQEEINDYTFAPPDIRFSELDFFLPAFNDRDETVKDILFMIDTSGSMSDAAIADCYSEIKGAIDQFGGKLTGWLGFFDAEVIKPKRFEDEEEFKVIRPMGGGGTSFSCVFNYVRDHIEEIEPVSIIILTDGYAPFPVEQAAMGIPVLWIINNEERTPTWGKIARIKYSGK